MVTYGLLHTSTPISRAFFVSSTSFFHAGSTFPSMNILDESPKYPLYSVVQSILTISPSWRIMSSLGMPWHTTSFTDIHTLLGYPSYPRHAGIASMDFV